MQGDNIQKFIDYDNTITELNSLSSYKDFYSDSGPVDEIITNSLLKSTVFVESYTEDNFKPHYMYDSSGVRILVKDFEKHLELSNLGYTHYDPLNNNIPTNNNISNNMGGYTSSSNTASTPSNTSNQTNNYSSY